MTLWQRVKASATRGLKAVGSFTAMRFQRYSSAPWLTWLPGTRYDYASSVGDGTGSSTVMAPLLWIARNFPEAPAALWKVSDDGQETQVRDHELLRLLRRPNAYYSGRLLWMATITSWNVDGNSYWIKVRRATGAVAELWWVPHWLITPKGDEKTFVTHYEYRPGSTPIELRREDVVHYRFGLDADNPLLGYSPLKSVLREVFTDDEAANFTASLLRNMGVPGLIISPDGDPPPSPDDVIAVKAYMRSAFTGDNRGEPIVMSGATNVEQFGFNPEQLQLRDLRRIPEERVSAVLGVPAIVAGLGAGLERSTFTNMGEAREMAYESNIIPSQGILSEDVVLQLLPDFEPDPFMWRFGFDLSKVRVLQEDLYRQAQRLDLAVRGGWARVAEARRAMGLPVEDADEVFLRSMNVVQVSAADGELVPLSSGSEKNGNHEGSAQEVERAVERALERRELTA